MASRYEVEVTISSAKDIKNVNWRNGPTRPYAVVWVDPRNKCSTKVDDAGDTDPVWDETLRVPLPPGPIDDDAKLCIDIVHAGPEEDVKPLIGSARLSLRDVLHEVGVGQPIEKKLKLKRPSGRPHGKVVVVVTIREPRGYPPPDAYQASRSGVPYGQPYGGPPPQPYDQPYGGPPPQPYDQPYAAPPSGYPYASPQSGYPQSGYGQPSYGYPQSGYGGQTYGQEEKKGSKFGGMGTGLAVGAVAGVLGGLALAEGVDALEDKIADDAAEKVEDDLGYDDDGDYGGGDDDY